jgi:hypothetical protein
MSLEARWQCETFGLARGNREVIAGPGVNLARAAAGAMPGL